MSSESPTPNMLDDARTGMNVFFIIIRVWAVSLEMFLRHSMGLRYPGVPGVAVLFFVPLFGCAWGGHNLVPLFLFLVAYFVMCARHQLTVAWREIRGERMGHTYYNGIPRICRWMPSLSEDRAKGRVEPLLVMFVGLITTPLNPPLGIYLLGGGICLLASDGIVQAIRRQQALAMHDALIEQQLLAEMFRELRSER